MRIRSSPTSEVLIWTRDAAVGTEDIPNNQEEIHATFRDEAQQRELEAIFQGRKGGPMGILAPLVATWLPTKKASIALQLLSNWTAPEIAAPPAR
jgi:hypothetical protein